MTLPAKASHPFFAGPLVEDWDRPDRWPLFTESFHLALTGQHVLAQAPRVTLDDLREERLMIRTYCESTSNLLSLPRDRQFDVARYHEVSAEADLFSLLEAGFGVAFVPESTKSPPTLMRVPVIDIDLERSVYLYGVAGRQRTAVAGAPLLVPWSDAIGHVIGLDHEQALGDRSGRVTKLAPCFNR